MSKFELSKHVRYLPRLTKLMSLVFSLMIVSGCAFDEKPDDPFYAPVIPEQPPERQVIDGSLFSKNQLVLFHDMKAHQVGDIITVILTEKTESEKKTETNIKKDATMALTNPTLFGKTPEFDSPVNLPLSGDKGLTLGTSLDESKDFKGKGNSDQSNKLQGTITVTVSKVFANGNLEVKGEKWMGLTNGDEYIRLSGIIRPQDISPENTVLSTRIADARIAYTGTGAMANASRPGWLTEFFSSGWWPF